MEGEADMTVLSGYEPERVFHFFEEISGIPRGSGNEKAISDYCVQFAKERNLEYTQDDLYNVIIRKPASPGYEKEEPVIFQGHLDMVCEKIQGSSHDFEKDGLSLFVDGDHIRAEGTTLGGDDGIAVAFALALLDDDKILHPTLEVILTVSEEVGMDGASGIDLSGITGRRMLNLDSEEEGVLLAGCAGGNTSCIRLPLSFSEYGGLDCGGSDCGGLDCEAGCKQAARIRISGLQGGHSGVEIIKKRGNANVILGKCLNALQAGGCSFSIISLNGGSKENVIPSQAEAELVIQDFEQAGSILNGVWKTLLEDYRKTDGNLSITLERTECKAEKVFSEETKEKVLRLFSVLPNGIQKMSEDIDGLVETSLNFGVLKTEPEALRMTYSVRSSVGTSKEKLTDCLRREAENLGADFHVSGNYPAWEYKADSGLRRDMVRIYEEMFGRKPEIQIIHAGLECGIFSEKLDGLDCISYGPDIFDIHSVNERMSISSVKRMWEYTLGILKNKNR